MTRKELKFPEDLKYTKTHEWIRIEGNVATVGITDFAQDQMGDIVYVELPEIGTTIKQGEKFMLVESSKRAEDINAPVNGTVAEVNEKLQDQENTILVNQSPYGEGWFVKIELEQFEMQFMDSTQYRKFISEGD